MGDRTFHVNWVHGYNGNRVCFVDDDTVAFKCGNFVKFKKLYSGKEEVFVGVGGGNGGGGGGGGVSVVEFHQTMPIFALTDAGPNPGLHVIEYSSSG